MSTIICPKCGQHLRDEALFCPKCGTPIESRGPLDAKGGVAAQPVQSSPYAQAQHQNSRGNVGRVVLIALLIILVLVVPVIPRDRVVYANGVTQVATMSTGYNTSIETYTTSSSVQVGVYQGTLQYIPDQYYTQNYGQNNFPYYYYGSQYPYYYYGYRNTPNCVYSTFDDYVCSYSYYYYPYSYYGNYYGYYPYGGYNSYAPYSGNYNNVNYNGYATTVTINSSDNVVQVQQTQESNDLLTLTLTHFDGSSVTYKHVTQQNLAQSATSTIPMTSVVTNTVMNSAVTPVTNPIQCQNCILQHVTDHVSLLQLLLGY